MSTAYLGLHSRCETIASFTTPGLISLSTSFITQGSPITVPEACVEAWPLPEPFVASANVCHVTLSVNTTESSTTLLEMFLPEKWNQRLLGTGTSGFSGCVDFPTVNYGAEMGFATVGTNAGHDGLSGAPVLHHPEMLNDFVWRSIHTEALVGKELVHQFYGSPASYSYYAGCSQGGRQGFRAAEQFPGDFDGILAGDPAIKLISLAAWFGLASEPFRTGKPGEMAPTDWAIVHKETLKQCDNLDGKADGIIAYPEDCHFRPEALLCSMKHHQPPCLSTAQVDGLRKLYSPVYLKSGKMLYPRFEPGAENVSPVFNVTFNGEFPGLALEGFRYIVYDDDTWDPSNFSIADVEYAIKTNRGDAQTWTGDLRKFKQRGGKLLTYHGTADSLIPSTISSLQYKMTAEVTGRLATMDSWYALYLVPGMEHCWGTPLGSAWRFGQMGGIPEPRAAKNTSDYNALLALVDWVEKEKQPKLSGLTDAGETREICRYPRKGQWVNGRWTCPSV
ncbi:Tannase/feruloyl esterase [Auriculariales sp. MPI-PUGE-AT-0066]|nr:Tannase/feruloyl esterase [Auriculariales sp. MPI-PUGE-AT-0066]